MYHGCFSSTVIVNYQETCMVVWYMMKLLFVPIPLFELNMGCVQNNHEPNEPCPVPDTESSSLVLMGDLKSVYTPEQCQVSQVPGRSTEYAAVSLVSSYYDTRGPLVMEYAIGTAAGNTDILEWTQYQGAGQV